MTSIIIPIPIFINGGGGPLTTTEKWIVGSIGLVIVSAILGTLWYWMRNG